MGGLNVLSVLVLSLAAPAQEPLEIDAGEGWTTIWQDLGALERMAPGSAGFRHAWSALDGIQARRERSARRRSDRPEAFRARVLRAHLLRMTNAPFRPVADPGTDFDFLPGEAWIAVQVAGPGPTRVRALRVSLDEVPADGLGSRIELGLALARGDADDLHLDWALGEAAAVHARVRGAGRPDDGSSARAAVLLARIRRLRGDHDGARSVLLGEVLPERPTGEQRAVETELARVLLAAGDTAASWKALGSALVSGSSDAQRILARRALEAGATYRARCLYRGLLEEEAPASSAARGYGLSLLTDAGVPDGASRNPIQIPR